MNRFPLHSLVVGAVFALLSSPAFAQPTISLLNPSSTPAGSPFGVSFTITGTNFCISSQVNFNGVLHPLEVSGSTTAFASIGPSEILTPGIVPVTVVNPTGVGCAVVGTSSPPTNFTITPGFTLSPSSLPGGSTGSPYSQTVTASGGTPPYTTPTVLSGSTPPGTVLSPGSAAFSFTPSVATTFTFTLSVNDAGSGSTSQPYTIVVSTPATATATTGTPQSATVNTSFATALTARVTDSVGLPVQGAQVTFTAPPTGPSGTFNGSNVVFTNASGNAAVLFKANTIAGSYVVTTAVAGLTATPPSFSLSNLPGFPTSITTTSGSGQSVLVGNTFSAPLVATVRDAFTNVVPGAPVTFTQTPPAGMGAGVASFSPSASVPANGNGQAIVTPTANTRAGSYTINASTTGVGVVAPFTLTNTAGFPSLVTAIAGTPQATGINTVFPVALRTRVTDSFGNPISGVTVTYFVGSANDGSTATFAGSNAVLTDINGVATAPALTANGVIGGPYNVTAIASGTETTNPVFVLTNTAGVPASITPTAGSGQGATIGTPYTTALQATVRDVNGSPVAGASVTFAAPTSGASGTFSGPATVLTGATGVATAPTFTANNIADNLKVTATTPGVAAPATFNLTNKPGPPTSITATVGAGQSAPINTAFPVALKATVRDASGNPVPGVSVTFAAPGSGARGTFTGPATVLTDASGVATAPTFTSNSVAGGYSVIASAAGVATPASFPLTNNPGPPASITATGGMNQNTIVSSAFQSPLQATVRDVAGNLVPNAQVTFSAPAAGASAAFSGPATVSTNLNGIATSPGLVANSIDGFYSATATVPGVAAAAVYPLVNTVGVSITTTQLPNGSVGTPYGASIGATGGRGSYTFSIGSGSLPPGLQFSGGSISGTPLTAGVFSIQVQVTDGSGSTASKTLTLRIVAQLTITTSSTLPTAFTGLGYGVSFTATGGEPPYTWSLSGGGVSALFRKGRSAVGGLPPGLNFDSSTGTLSGTPTVLGDFSFGVQVRDNAQHVAGKSFSLTSALSPGLPTPPGPPNTGAPAVKVSQATLNFGGPAGGDIPPPQYVSVVAANLAPLAATIQIDSGNPGTPQPPWLKARFVSAVTPARLAILTDQTGLAAGVYSGRVLVKYGDSQTLSVNVNFTIDLTPPHLTVAPGYLKFAAIAGQGGVLEQALLVGNSGTGGAIDFTATVVSNSPWLTVTPSAGKTVVSGGVPLRVLVNTQGLKLGSYLGKIRVESPTGGSTEVPVSLFLSPNAPIIALSTVGVRFDARQGNGLTNSREVAVLNVGTGTVNWTAALKIGGQGWLSLNPGSGQATPNTPGRLIIAADPRQQRAGVYYALIEITDPAAANSPQFLVAVLNVQPSTSEPEPDLSPAGLSFTAVAGGPNPAPQTLTVFGGGDTPVAFQSAASSDDGGAWISIDKTNGAASTQTPGQIAVNVNSANLRPGVYTGDVSVSFSSQTIRTANVTLSVLPQGAVLASTDESGKQRSATGCTAGKLAITSTSLVNAFSSPAGWPTPLSVRVTDDCSSAVPNAQVVATFSNGDPPLKLSLTNPVAAQYSGTWAPGRTAPQMTVTVSGVAQGLSSATARLTGTIGVNGAPALTPNGTVNILSGTLGGAVAPGTIVQIAGGTLSPETAQPGVFPLPTTFNNTSVLIGPFVAPLYSLSRAQISAQIPTELQPDRQYPILVSNGGAFTLPDTVTTTSASPGLLNMAQHADFRLITPAAPATPGESIILYLVGMGATNPPVASGDAAPADPPALTNLQPVVRIGGATASYVFAGLTPGLVGVYQINAEVPTGVVAPGDVSVTVTQNDFDSNTVTIPVR